MSELRQEAEAIAEQFSDHLDVGADEVEEERLENLVNEYRVPLDEARRSVTNSYLEDAGMERDELGRGGRIGPCQRDRRGRAVGRPAR